MRIDVQSAERVLQSQQCVTDDEGRWHVVMDLDESRDQMAKEVVEFYLAFDDTGRPRVKIQQVGSFVRSHPKGSWSLQKVRIRKLRREETRRVIEQVRWIAGYYATIETRDPEREELPKLSRSRSVAQSEPAPMLGDGFTVIRTYACPNELSERIGRHYFTIPREEDLLVTEVWCGDRVVEMSAYGISRSGLRVLKSQGVPYGVPDEEQWKRLDAYFWRRLKALTTKMDNRLLDKLPELAGAGLSEKPN